ncbi:hypothetical protein [Geothrix fuzhouensis]|uniref:hypothetical protein n=1 Tax=Geothrix fuzhouensis TaxID=2966451 RepID=UPI002147404F|nr:hypothetical protein [Geothrix fuzhouensis]
MNRLTAALALLALAALGGFFGGLTLGLRHAKVLPPRVLVVGGDRKAPEADHSAQDVRVMQGKGAKPQPRTVITARVEPGEPAAPPIPNAPQPAWTTDWTLNLPQDRPCPSPTLHVATALHLEGNQVVAESTGWAECAGLPVSLGGVRQVERRTELRLPMLQPHPWRTGLLWAPPQRGEGKQFGLVTTYDLAPRVFVGGWALPDRQGLVLGFSW